MAASVLYFHTGSSSFVNKDIDILREIGAVKQFSFTSTSKTGTPLLFFKQLVFLLSHLRGSRLLVVQFAGYHSFLPALLSRLSGKPCLIVSGGTDCHSFPGVGYGNLQKRFLGLFTKWSFRLCTHIAPKHASLWECNYDYDPNEPSRQGIAALIPGIKTPCTVIPNGYDADQWKPDPSIQRIPRSFLTVSGGFHFPFQRALKGIDLMLEAARKSPECTFTLIGVKDTSDWNDLPPNFRVLPPADNETLLQAYCSHAFYLQLSMAEGFPNALCESMLCGCIPIGSAVFSIPEIIGGNGYILRHRNIDELLELLSEIVDKHEPEKALMARESISRRFPISKRKSELLALCTRILPDGR